MEKALIEIGLQKAGYYADRQQTQTVSTNSYTTGVWDWRDGLICITETNVTGAFNNGHAGIMAWHRITI